MLLELVVLALVLWLAHYFHFRFLGLYEDDYSHTSPALGWDPSQLLDMSLRAFVAWNLGRPLGFALGPLLAFLGARLGGLSAIYVIGYLVQATNAFLFYFLLRRIGHGNIAFIGALIFAVFPADTTHIFLMHAFGLHTSLTLLLIATHCYLSGRKALAYALSLGCLLIYESPYAVFLAVPLLLEPWDRELIRKLFRHAAVWFGILLAVIVIRGLLAEGRIESLGSDGAALVTTWIHILAALVIGPAVSLALFWQGPSWTFSHWNAELTVVFLGCLVILFFILSRSKLGFLEEETAGSFQIRLRAFGRALDRRFRVAHPRTAKLLVAAPVMLSLAYAFSFTHFPPTVAFGRLTSVHLAAAFGGALFFAGLVSLFLSYARSHRMATAALVLLAAYLSWVLAYRFSIQQDFEKAWRNQQTFWAGVIQQVPDMTEGTIILVTRAGLPTTHFIETNSWADPVVLQQIFRFPSGWQTPPRLFVVSSNWTKGVDREGDQILWRIPAATWDAHWEALPDSNVVLLTMENGSLVRQFGSILMHRLPLNLKPLPSNAPPAWVHGALYPLLISAGR